MLEIQLCITGICRIHMVGKDYTYNIYIGWKIFHCGLSWASKGPRLFSQSQYSPNPSLLYCYTGPGVNKGPCDTDGLHTPQGRSAVTSSCYLMCTLKFYIDSMIEHIQTKTKVTAVQANMLGCAWNTGLCLLLLINFPYHR